MHPEFLPYPEEVLAAEHFRPSDKDRLAAWRKRISDEPAKVQDDPSFLYRDETLWTAGGLLAVHRHPEASKRWESVLRRAFGDQPPLDEATTWPEMLDGELRLWFEVGLSSPTDYREWLSANIADRHPLRQQVQLGKTRGTQLEGRTHLDALLLNPATGFALHIESKVLSDIDAKISFDALRNQLARNIDCMAAKPQEGPLGQPDRSLLALLTPDLFRKRPHSRLYGHLFHEYTDSGKNIKRDLEHLDAQLCASLSRRLGWITFGDLQKVEPAACRWLNPPA
jgi:hypothetical protein